MDNFDDSIHEWFLLDASCIPFGQVPSGSFFRLATMPGKRFQKTAVAGVALTEDSKMVLLKEDAPCVVLSGEAK